MPYFSNFDWNLLEKTSVVCEISTLEFAKLKNFVQKKQTKKTLSPV